MRIRQTLHPMPPDRAVPIMFEMGQVVGGFDQRGPLAAGGVRDADFVSRLAELDLLIHNRFS